MSGLTRVRVVANLEPEVVEYIELKGLAFARGRRSGFSEALNRMVIFCRDYEIEQEVKDVGSSDSVDTGGDSDC